MSDKIQVVKGIAFWCDPHNINKLSGKYVMKLGRLDDKAVAAFKAVGISVQFDSKTPADSVDNMGSYITLKSKNPITPKDMDGKDLPEKLKIGNGSVVYAAFRLRDWEFKGRAGVSAEWLGLKVQELVVFDPEASNKKKADQLLDGVSGEGFRFGEESSETAGDEEFDELFGDVA